MPTRTPQEIAARIRAIRAAGNDLFGFAEEVLLGALDPDHATGFLSSRTSDYERITNLDAYARWYLTFAIGKILAHRGISASRSVTKLRELAWLLGRDDVVAAMDAAGYPTYGAPIVRAFADGFGWPFLRATDDPDGLQRLTRMASGLECDPDGCRRGCAD